MTADPFRLLADLVTSGTLRSESVSLSLSPEALARHLLVAEDALHPDLLAINAPLQLRRRGVETKLGSGEAHPAPDPTLLRQLALTHCGVAAVRRGEMLTALARLEGCSGPYVRSRLPLAHLSPRIQAAIVAGTQPVELTAERLVRSTLPLDWQAQERMLGLTG